MATTQIKKLQVGAGAVQFINEATSEILAQFTPSASLKLYRKDDQILIMDKSGMQHTVKASLVTKLTYEGTDNAFAGTVQQLWDQLATNFFFELSGSGTFSPILFDAVVDAAGAGDYLTVNEAVTAGACTIFIKDGTYVEPASTTLSDNCALYGESSGVVLVFGAAQGLIVNGGGVDKTGGSIAVTGASITITGTGTNFLGTDVGRTINIGTDFFTIAAVNSTTELELTTAWQGESTTGLDYTIRDYTTGVILETINVIGGGGASSPISFTNSLNCTLKNIYVEGGGQDNLLITNSGRIAVDNLISKGAVSSGISLVECIGAKVSKSTASNCGLNGFDVSGGTGVSISQCFGSNNGNAGFESRNSNEDLVIDNVNASYNDVYGIDIQQTDKNVVVSNSVCIGNGTSGIQCDSEQAQIIGNTVTGKGKGVGATQGIAISNGAARVIGNNVNECATGFVIGLVTEGSLIASNESNDCSTGYNCSDDSCTYVGNVASGFEFRGFLVSATNNNFISNRAYGGTGVNAFGFQINGASNLFVGNISYSNVNGYQINADNNRLISNEANNNSGTDYLITSPSTRTYGSQTNYANVGIGGAPDASAILTLTSTTKGLLIPRMTAAQASAITAVDGLILYATDTDLTFTSIGVWAYESGAWTKL